jgi:hypothetical protein
MNWAFFWAGAFVASLIVNFMLVGKVSNNDITINRPKQKNKNSKDNVQDFNSNLTDGGTTEKKGVFKRMKEKRQAKREQKIK